MLYILLVKASNRSESEAEVPLYLREAMDAYNEALLKAGVRVMAKGLKPSSKGLRLYFNAEHERYKTEEGPFDPLTGIISGFIIIDVATEAEAVYWAMQMPDPIGGGEGQIELRALYA